MRFDLASFTDPGGRGSNEERVVLIDHRTLIAGIVADGAGEHGGGDIAAQLVVDTVSDVLRDCATRGTSVETEQLADAMLAANRAIVDAQCSGGARSRMRSTIAILTIDPLTKLANWAHCGDTRIYCFREGRIALQTSDHRAAPHSIEANRRAALGTEGALEVEAARAPFPIEEGDVFLACCHGFCARLDEASLIDTIGEARDAASWLAALAAHARRAVSADAEPLSAIAVWAGSPRAM
ncbi:Serine/threonine phosphatase stp [Caballeronia temeraria]|uniref:Serine/threonine phosphatase stp n=1 Tax=Caballeronia temeraria TaxID=1777137 RepID=A0A157ZSJ6_9BURK|nr:protein phosphatase 2C domain-containing protein [Caballeronia temeraria]SAK48475.1 Serine/threonine phosphatase stp [Caballeronia temeraria]